MGNLHQVQTAVLILLAFIVGFGTLAHVMRVAYPILLVIGGLAVSFIPGLPRIGLQPDLIFTVMLPPLLFSAAFTTSWREFRANLESILSLAFALVAFTVAGVALAAHLFLPGFDWRLGLVLGAILSPTDAIAATAIARRVGLPRRVVDILEGESLVNDGSGLLALQVTVGMLVSGQTPTPLHLAASLVYLVIGGIAVGLVVGRLIYQFELWMDDGPVEVTASIVTPYIAYFGAEMIHASGVLAAVACGLYLGRRSSSFFSSGVRLQTASTWNTLTFVLNGIAFILIGLQLPVILHGIRTADRDEVVVSAAWTIAAIIGLRLIWVYPSAFLARFFRARILRKENKTPLSPKGLFVVGWTGMRGVVSLAAAFSLPTQLADGSPLPQRNIILVITFAVIFVTVVVQGLSLPPLIRLLNLRSRSSLKDEERAARRLMTENALQEADRIRSESDDDSAEVIDDLAHWYHHRLSGLEADEDGNGNEGLASQAVRRRQVGRKLRDVERSTLIELRDESKISDVTLRKLERELDLLDLRFENEF